MDRLLEATARAERDHFWFHGFRRFVQPLLARATEGLDAPLILDCGCGTGHNLTMLRQYGRAWGIDLTWRGLEFARSRGEHLVAQASVDRLPFSDARFHLVTSFDVLYALPDEVEQAAIQEMYRVLRPGGQVLINVAAMPMLAGNHSVLSAEVRRYTRAGLARRLEGAGFRVRRITYTNFSLLPLVLAVRLAQKISGHHESDSEMTIPSTPVNSILTAALAVEARALKLVDLPAGSSLLALAYRV